MTKNAWPVEMQQSANSLIFMASEFFNICDRLRENTHKLHLVVFQENCFKMVSYKNPPWFGNGLVC